MSSGNNLIFWMVIIFLCAINLLVTRVWNSPQALSSFQSLCRDGNRQVWGGDSPRAHRAGRKVLTQPHHTSFSPEFRKRDEEGGWGNNYTSKSFSLFLGVPGDRLLFIQFMGFSWKFYWIGLPFLPPVDSVLKSKAITLPTKVHIVKAMVFPVGMYRGESWTVKKAECWKIDAFQL